MSDQTPLMTGFPPEPTLRVTQENWQQPPYNRWGFRNARRLVPTAEIWRGRGPVVELPRDDRDLGTPDLGGFSFRGDGGRALTLDGYLEESKADGCIVLRAGKVVYERYFAGMTDHCLHLSQSVAKSLVGTLAGILIEEGVIALDRPVQDYVPELVGCGYKDARVAHLLDMASGVAFGEDYADPDSDVTRLEISCGWRSRPAGWRGPATIYDVALTLAQERPHGESFLYRSIETDVLGWILERASGRHLTDLLSEKIWARLGCEADACMTVDSTGTALADGGYNATLRDYARFGQTMLQNGTWNGARIVPAAWIEDIAAGETARDLNMEWRGLPHACYRRKWWLPERGRPLFMALGIFGQMIAVDQANDMVVVKLGTWENAIDPRYALEDVKLVRALGRDLGRDLGGT